MNTIRSCFAAIVAFLVVAIDWSAADAVVCCNSSSVASGCGVAYCQNENQKFHTIEAIGGGTCDDNRTALPVRKCCPPGQPYDPEVRFCGPADADDDKYLRQMMRRLRDGFRVVADAEMVGYDYEQPKCDVTQVLVDVPAVEVRGLMEEDSSAIELPPGYCFDMTPTDELVARTCRLRDQYCGRDGYTCVNKCCKCDQMYVIDDDGRKCKQSEKPFTMFAYETDADGRTAGRSNSTVLPYNVEPRCFTKQMVKDGFILTTDGSLYLTGDRKRVPDVWYCVDYYAEAGAQVDAVLQAFVCGEDTRDSWVYIFIRASDMASVVCLALTLLGFNTLPSLQNSRNYYIKPYIASEIVSFLCSVIKEITNEIRGYTGRKCKQSEKPFTMFAYETDADGRTAGRSNSTVLPYNVEPRCFTKQMVKDGFILTTDGSLYLTGDRKRVPDVWYCVDYYAEAGAQVDAVLQAFVCGEDTRNSWVYIFIRASDMASVVCLALTLLVYNILPSLQNSRNYYVKFYMACELVSSSMYASQWFTEDLKGHACVLYGYFTLFSILTSICWLNVICFDIYWMLRYNISINRNTSISVRTIMYHIYCWGFSSICVSTGYLFQHSQNETLLKFSPNIGDPVCWFKSKSGYGILIFFLLPSTVMVTTNLIICFLTAIYFLRTKSKLNGFKGSNSKTESFLVYKEKFLMSIKLFLIMGTSYFFWILCSLFQIEEGIIWNFSDAMTSLQGVIIFIIFVAKRKVIMDLRKKFRRAMNHSESTQINTISGSS